MNLSIHPEFLTPVHTKNPCQVSYNIEMTELMGGTFWAPYTKAQVAGIEAVGTFGLKEGETYSTHNAPIFTKMDPVDLYDPRIRACAKALGPAIVRYSGTWANAAYYDLDDHTNGAVPDGFQTVLTRSQWQGALDFAKAVDAKILVSLANSWGVHENGTGRWLPDQAKALWDYTEAQGMKIDYVEFMNQPDLDVDVMLPPGYTMSDMSRDHDLFAAWLKENHPETILVGLSCCNDIPRRAKLFGQGEFFEASKRIFDGMRSRPQIFSCHAYSGASERLLGTSAPLHWPFEQVLSEEYLGVTMEDLAYYASVRDQYTPGSELWVTESGDAYGGGNTWASTFAEAIRFLDEQCRFCREYRGILFHNTLVSSAYGFLDVFTHLPRPQYWAALLFNQLTGEMVFDTHERIRQGVHLYAFGRKDGKEGACYILINNSTTETVTLEIPQGVKYVLSSDGLRSERTFLNGSELLLAEDGSVPSLQGQPIKAGALQAAPATITYLIV